MSTLFMASTGAGDSGRRVVWAEHANGTVSAHEFGSWDEGGGLLVDSRGIFATALAKGYRSPVPDLLLGQLARAVQLDGPTFENVSALLTVCEIPLDAERLPMHAGQVSRSP